MNEFGKGTTFSRAEPIKTRALAPEGPRPGRVAQGSDLAAIGNIVSAPVLRVLGEEPALSLPKGRESECLLQVACSGRAS
jgi:hypothetical protein